MADITACPVRLAAVGGFEGDIDDVHHLGTVNGRRFDGLPCEQC